MSQLPHNCTWSDQQELEQTALLQSLGVHTFYGVIKGWGSTVAFLGPACDHKFMGPDTSKYLLFWVSSSSLSVPSCNHAWPLFIDFRPGYFFKNFQSMSQVFEKTIDFQTELLTLQPEAFMCSAHPHTSDHRFLGGVRRQQHEFSTYCAEPTREHM